MLPFKPQTTYAAGFKKAFTWSYSKIKNYRNCPRKHNEVDLLKNFQEGRSKALEDGDFIHKAMELRCSRGTPLPPAIKEYEREARAALDVTPPGSVVLVEEKAAIRKDFSPCGYFDKDVWLRMKIDFAKISGKLASLRDWKTGRIVEDSEQLALTAQWVFSAYPEVQLVVTRYIWLGNNAETRLDFKREDMKHLWAALWPELEQYEQACATNNFPPKPGGLCKSYCPVKTCEFWQKGSPR